MINHTLVDNLAEKAGWKPLPGADFANSLQEDFNRKFAELIVKECLNIIKEKCGSVYFDFELACSVNETGHILVEKIKERFEIV